MPLSTILDRECKRTADVPDPPGWNPQARCATSESPQAGSEPSTAAECSRSIAVTSLGVAGLMEGQANPFTKQTNCFSSPSARRTWSVLDRRKPPRNWRPKECSPGETWYTLTCSGEMAPTFEPSRTTLTPPIAGLRRWSRPRPSRETARTTATVGNAGHTRLGARQTWMVAPASSSSMPSEVSAPEYRANMVNQGSASAGTQCAFNGVISEADGT